MGKHLLGTLYYQFGWSPIFGVQETSVPLTTVGSSQEITMVEELVSLSLRVISDCVQPADGDMYGDQTSLLVIFRHVMNVPGIHLRHELLYWLSTRLG